jgi:glycosyltransferase involved in cell wall biosynthesis
MAADKLVVISPYFLKWFPQASVVYPFLPIDLACVKAKGDRSKEKEVFHFLFLGALEKERGIETMLEGFAAALRRSERPLFLSLAWNGYGDYTLHYIQTLLSHLGIRKEVRIHGIVDRVQAYSKCDAVLIPHTSETRMAFPVRILESLHMRKPLIVTDAYEMGGLINGCGLEVKRGDIEEMAEAMIRLGNDPELYQECVRKCDTLLEAYNSDRSLTQLYKCIVEAGA